MQSESAAVHQFTDQNFKEDAASFDGVVLVDFWAPWCGPCKIMGPRIEELAVKYADNKQVRVGQLNVDDNPETQGAFRVLSIPTFKFFINGEQVDEQIGAVPTVALEQKLEKALASLPKAS